MSAEDKPMTREERLAAKLRENLRRRKAQARELGSGKDSATTTDSALPKSEPRG